MSRTIKLKSADPDGEEVEIKAKPSTYEVTKKADGSVEVTLGWNVAAFADQDPEGYKAIADAWLGDTLTLTPEEGPGVPGPPEPGPGDPGPKPPEPGPDKPTPDEPTPGEPGPEKPEPPKNPDEPAPGPDGPGKPVPGPPNGPKAHGNDKGGKDGKGKDAGGALFEGTVSGVSQGINKVGVSAVSAGSDQPTPEPPGPGQRRVETIIPGPLGIGP